MSHSQYWATRVPMSLFEQTQYELDQVFYATFPAARDAAHFPQQPFNHQSQLSHYSPPRLIEIEPVYIPSNQPYHHHQYSSEPTSRYIPQSHPSPVPTREPTFLVYQSPYIPLQANNDIQETHSDGHPASPRHSFRQLNRHMKPPTLKFTNNCQLGVMRLDRLSDPSPPNSPILNGQSHPLPSEPSHVASCQTTPPPTEFLLNSPKSPSIGLSSLPSKNSPEKKPPLACLFCRGRKIACGPPLPGSIKKTCNQCRKRSQTCYYPTQSRRGMRKKKPVENKSDVDVVDTTTKIKRKRKNQK